MGTTGSSGGITRRNLLLGGGIGVSGFVVGYMSRDGFGPQRFRGSGFLALPGEDDSDELYVLPDPRLLGRQVAHPSEGDMTTLPSKVAGVYWTGWNPRIKLTAIPTGYNLIYLFAARPTGTSGDVAWPHDPLNVADIKTCRARGQRIILSCGGAGHGIDFSSRVKSQAFVNSVIKLNAGLGGTESTPMIDGLDFNTFEADATRNVAEYVWMGRELKNRLGPGFIISSPPAPWNKVDREFCKTLLGAGAMDYAAPQFYDSENLVKPDRIVSDTDIWVKDVAGGDASKICVGFGITKGSSVYSTPEQIVEAWGRIEKNHANIRGAFLWQHKTDSDSGWAFANQVIPLIGAELQPPTPPTPPTPDENYQATSTTIVSKHNLLAKFLRSKGIV